MDQYKEYLAANVLNDGKIVTYRLLSRALKVHVDIAKQMLFDFHYKQNAKKANSVHATYLLTGKKRTTTTSQTNGVHSQDGEDSIMQSSPFTSSMPDPEEPAEGPKLITAIILCKEEQLEETKTELVELTSIHVYSIQPGPIENMNMLSVCNQEIIKKYSDDDPLERWKIYGTFHNPHVKRRTTKYIPPTTGRPSTVAPAPASRLSVGGPTKPTGTAKEPLRRGNESEESKSGRSTPQPESETSKAVKKGAHGAHAQLPSLKRDKSDIFKSFAKAKAKPKKPEVQSSKEATHATEDEPMQGMSEDEDEGDYTPELEKESEEKAAERRRKKAEDEVKRRRTQEELRRMMEDDDDVDMDDTPETGESQDAPLDKDTPKSAEPEPPVTSQGGRRRGRRRVMKKKTMKDEEGFLVTREEPVWESFSEDEPEPKRPKPAPAKAASTAKGKKGGTGKHGNIASFFTKK